MNSAMPRRRSTGQRRQGGFTVIELMVALLIGLIILAAVGQIFVASRVAFSYSQGMARTQEGGHFGMEFLAWDLRMAGYTGCNSKLPASSITNIASPPSEVTDFHPDGILGFTYTGTGSNNLGDWTPSLPAGFFADGEVAPNTDVVIVQYAEPRGATIVEKDPANANIKVSSGSALGGSIAAGDVLIVTDCRDVDIFKASSVSRNAGIVTIAHASNANTANNLSKSYDTRGELMRLVSNAYYVGWRDNDPSNPAGLMRKVLRTTTAASGVTPQSLIEGVESMRVLYGWDSVGDDRIPDTYVTADIIDTGKPAGSTDCPGAAPCPDWDRVMAVRIGVVVGTPENVDREPDARIYHVLGDTTNAFDDYGPVNDNRRRQVFSTTVQLRNVQLRQ